MAPATLISRWAASACTQPAAPSFALPFIMVSDCINAQRKGTCTDGGCSICSTARNDPIRCELCNCSFPPASLQQHQSGKQHLRNVASNGAQQSPLPQLAPTIQSVPLASISPTEEGNTSTCETDPRVNVSGEGGLDFFVEANPFFSSANHNISIERTNVSSNLSLQSITLRPSLDSWCE